MSLVTLTRSTVAPLGKLRFDSVHTIYNPLDYAWDVHRQWLQRYGQGRKQVLLLGMNPGPFGMAQTGVPFGEIEAVRSFLRLRGKVRAPESTHPKRPVLGFACPRSEVSGRRVWTWVARRFVIPERFFRRFFVHNYCPLAFVSETGANVTPDKLPAEQRQPLFDLCDRLLLATISQLQPQWLLGVGAFAEDRARRVVAAASGRQRRGLPQDLQFGRIPHPSPASPAANRGWEPLVDRALEGLGLGDAGSGSGAP